MGRRGDSLSRADETRDDATWGHPGGQYPAPCLGASRRLCQSSSCKLMARGAGALEWPIFSAADQRASDYPSFRPYTLAYHFPPSLIRGGCHSTEPRVQGLPPGTLVRYLYRGSLDQRPGPGPAISRPGDSPLTGANDFSPQADDHRPGSVTRALSAERARDKRRESTRLHPDQQLERRTDRVVCTEHYPGSRDSVYRDLLRFHCRCVHTAKRRTAV